MMQHKKEHDNTAHVHPCTWYDDRESYNRVDSDWGFDEDEKKEGDSNEGVNLSSQYC